MMGESSSSSPILISASYTSVASLVRVGRDTSEIWARTAITVKIAIPLNQ